jgi:Mg2+ and Co2+ transporter CorA
MEFTKEQLEQIGSYIESNFDRFGAKSNVIQLRPYDIQLIERMTRIEEELRSQREVILKQNETIQFGFAQMDKRFESMQKQIDERFAAVDRRFEMVQKSMDTRFEMMQKNMDNRFEQVEKRFDDVNKKFTMMMWMTSAGFTIIATVITLLTIFAR